MLKRPSSSDLAPRQEPQIAQEGIGPLLGSLPSIDGAPWTPSRRKDRKQGPPFAQVARAIRLNSETERARDQEIEEQIRLCEQGSYEDQLRGELELGEQVQAEQEEIAAAVAHGQQDGGNHTAKEKAKLEELTKGLSKFLDSETVK